MIVSREIQSGRHDLSLRMQAQAIGKAALEFANRAKEIAAE